MGPIVLRGLLSSTLYHRLHLLSFITRLLLSSNRYADEADKLIKNFHKITEENQGLDVFSANMHSLNHLPWQVKNFGPLWCTSAIMFESANHLLKAKFSGTVNHLRLIVERYNRYKSIKRRKPVKDALHDLCLILRKEKKSFQPNHCVQKNWRGGSAEKFWFYTCSIKNLNLQSISKSEPNAYVSFMSEGDKLFGVIEKFFSFSSTNYGVVSCFTVIECAKPENFDLNIFSFIHVKLSGKQIECKVSDISGKMLKAVYDGKIFLSPLLDVFEHD